jgi:hypothetical protein
VGDPFISSDPSAWLRPYFATLKRQPFFANLAPELQAAALADAIEPDYPTKAAEIRQWNAATRRAMLACIEQGLAEGRAAKDTELWRMRKGSRELRCVAVYIISGIDLRQYEGDEMRRTALFQDAPYLQGESKRWRAGLEAHGWTLL